MKMSVKPSRHRQQVEEEQQGCEHWRGAHQRGGGRGPSQAEQSELSEVSRGIPLLHFRWRRTQPQPHPISHAAPRCPQSSVHYTICIRIHRHSIAQRNGRTQRETRQPRPCTLVRRRAPSLRSPSPASSTLLAVQGGLESRCRVPATAVWRIYRMVPASNWVYQSDLVDVLQRRPQRAAGTAPSPVRHADGG